MSNRRNDGAVEKYNNLVAKHRPKVARKPLVNQNVLVCLVLSATGDTCDEALHKLTFDTPNRTTTLIEGEDGHVALFETTVTNVRGADVADVDRKCMQAGYVRGESYFLETTHREVYV